MRAGWLDGETTATGKGVGDAEERGESPEIAQGNASISTSSDAGGGTGIAMGCGFDGKAEM